MLLLRHRDTGNPKGAFVEFASAEEVGKAVERNGMVQSSCFLWPDEAEPADLAPHSSHVYWHGFVCMLSPEAQHDFGMHLAQELMGRSLRIDVAEAKPDRGERCPVWSGCLVDMLCPLLHAESSI